MDSFKERFILWSPQKTGNFTFKRLFPNPKIQTWGLGSLLYYWLFPLYLSNSAFNCETWPKAISPLSIPFPEKSWVIAQIYFFLKWHALAPPSPSLEDHFYLKYEPAFQRGNKNHQGELHQILWIGTRRLISKVRWLQGRKPRSRDASGLICGQASEVACWVGNDHQPPAKCYRNFSEDSLAGSQLTPGGFVRSTPKVKLVEQIKCLIYLGIFELVWQEGGKKKTFSLQRLAMRETTTPASQVNTNPIFT